MNDHVPLASLTIYSTGGERSKHHVIRVEIVPEMFKADFAMSLLDVLLFEVPNSIESTRTAFLFQQQYYYFILMCDTI